VTVSVVWTTGWAHLCIDGTRLGVFVYWWD